MYETANAGKNVLGDRKITIKELKIIINQIPVEEENKPVEVVLSEPQWQTIDGKSYRFYPCLEVTLAIPPNKYPYEVFNKALTLCADYMYR